MKEKINTPCIILPIEIKVRELYSKFYLGCVAAERGFNVIFGGSVDLRDRSCWLPRGAFFIDKSAAPSRQLWFDVYHKLGLRISGWCEEGLVFNDEEEYLRRKIDSIALSRMESFFVWGPNQENVIKRAVSGAEKILSPTGNPRVDLLSKKLRPFFEDDAKKIQKEHPSMILINTNFSHCNHAKSENAFLELLKNKGAIKNSSDEKFIIGFINHKKRLFDAFVEMIPRLSEAFPDKNIVIRPHPSENSKTWENIADSYPNVSMIYDGPAVPWLLAAEVVVHNGCTTGVEAALLEKEVIAYTPVQSEAYDFTLPNEASCQANDLYSLIEILKKLENNHSGFKGICAENRETVLGNYLYNIEGNASDAIVDRLWTLAHKRTAESTFDTLVCRLRRKYWQVRLKKRLKREPEPYVVKKFPGLTNLEVEDLLAEYQKLTGRFGNLVTDSYMDKLFIIQQKSD